VAREQAGYQTGLLHACYVLASICGSLRFVARECWTLPPALYEGTTQPVHTRCCKRAAACLRFLESSSLVVYGRNTDSPLQAVSLCPPPRAAREDGTPQRSRRRWSRRRYAADAVVDSPVQRIRTVKGPQHGGRFFGKSRPTADVLRRSPRPSRCGMQCPSRHHGTLGLSGVSTSSLGATSSSRAPWPRSLGRAL